MSTLDEKNLIERTQAGNPEAFSPLVEKYHHHELPIKVIAVAHGESPHFGLSHLKDHVPKLIVVDGGLAYQDFPFVDRTVKFGLV